ncbi:MAG: hypothetical protein MI784_01820, partial [Cytophagales bacterium]|nr:hypothetical protein [Cytophagales bacterium]
LCFRKKEELPRMLEKKNARNSKTKRLAVNAVFFRKASSESTYRKLFEKSFRPEMAAGTWHCRAKCS